MLTLIKLVWHVEVIILSLAKNVAVVNASSLNLSNCCTFFVDHGWEKPVFPEHVKRVDWDHHAGTDKSRACQVRNTCHNSCSSKGHFWWTGKKESFVFVLYSWIPLIRTRLFRTPRHCELKTISLGFQSFTIGYFKLPLFWTIFGVPSKLEIAGFNFNVSYIGPDWTCWPKCWKWQARKRS